MNAPELTQYEGDKKFQVYADDLEKSLTLFEKAHEWADLIKCLQKVAGTLQKYSQYGPAIPHKLTLAKRLAQCTNSALPSGVHLKTLEVYNLIFHRLGQVQLARDIGVYLHGLLPLFAHAATAVKPQVLALVSAHLASLPLPSLAAVLPGLVHSLLPGLSEGEQGEGASQTLALLKQLQDRCSQHSPELARVYWGAIWRSLLQAPSLRLAALHLLLHSLPRPSSDASSSADPLSANYIHWDAAVHVPDRDALVAGALHIAAIDNDLLTQRLALDLLIACFPVHLEYSSFLAPVKYVPHFPTISIFAEVAWVRVIGGALRVLVRREVSLNRRLYFYLLGVSPSDPTARSAEDQRRYFNQYSRVRTLKALNEAFGRSVTLSSSSLAVQPFKVLVGLLERAEIGEALVTDTLPHVLKAMQHALSIIELDGNGSSISISSPQPKKDDNSPKLSTASSVRKGAEKGRSVRSPEDFVDNLGAARAVLSESLSLLEALKAELVWARLASLAESALENEQALPLLSMALHYLTSTEAQRAHLPGLLATMLRCIHRSIAKPTSVAEACHLLLPMLSLSLRILGRLESESNASSDLAGNDSLRSAVALFDSAYVTIEESLLVPEWQREWQETLNSRSTLDPLHPSSSVQLTESLCTLLVGLHAWRGPARSTDSHLDLISKSDEHEPTPLWLTGLLRASMSQNPLVACASIKSICTLLKAPGALSAAQQLSARALVDLHNLGDVHALHGCCARIALRLWALLDGGLPTLHYRVVSLFVELASIALPVCHAVLLAALGHVSLPRRVDAFRRFSLLWRVAGEISAPSSLMPAAAVHALIDALDAHSHDETLLRLTARTWLAEVLTAHSISRLLDPLLDSLLDIRNAREPPPGNLYQSIFSTQQPRAELGRLTLLFEVAASSFAHPTLVSPLSSDMALRWRSFAPSLAAASDSATDSEHSGIIVGSCLRVNTYADLLVMLGAHYLSSQAPDGSPTDFSDHVILLQETAADFLSVLLSRIAGLRSVSRAYARVTRGALLDALAVAVAKAARARDSSFRSLVLQVSLLRLLRLVVELEYEGVAHIPESLEPSLPPSDDSDSLSGPKFLQTLIMGLLQSHATFNVRVYWLEFITQALPMLYQDLEAIIVPVASCLSDLLGEQARQSQRFNFIHTQEVMGLLTSLRHVVGFVLFGVRPGLSSNDGELLAEQGFVDLPRSESGSGSQQFMSLMKDLGGFLSAPFVPAARRAAEQQRRATSSSSESPASTTAAHAEKSVPPSTQASAALVKQLPTIIASLAELWEAIYVNRDGKSEDLSPRKEGGITAEPVPNFTDDAAHVRSVLRDSLLAIVDPVFREYPSAVLKGLVRDWKFLEREAWLDLADSTMSSKSDADSMRQNSLLMLLQAIPSFNITQFFFGARTLLSEIRDKPTEHRREVTFISTLDFVKCFLSSYSGTDILDSWPEAKLFYRDVLSLRFASASSGASSLSTLFTLTSLHVWVKNADVSLAPGMASPSSTAKGNGGDQKKFFREVQELVASLLGASLFIATDQLMQGGHIRDNSVLIDSKPISLSLEALAITSLRVLTKVLPPLLLNVYGTMDRIAPIITQVVRNVLPMSHPEAPLVVSNASVEPQFEKSFDIMPIAVLLIDAMVVLDFDILSYQSSTGPTTSSSSLSMWLKSVMDIFYLPGFFRVPEQLLKAWSSLLSHLISRDESIWSDCMKHLGKVLSSGPVSLFAAKPNEKEDLIRPISMKRLSFLVHFVSSGPCSYWAEIYSAPVDTFQTQMVPIQERIVEALRVKLSADATIALVTNVFLTLRVILARFTFSKIDSFWPVIMTELIRVFSPASPLPPLVVAATKFLDLAMLLASEKLLLWEWVFFRDKQGTNAALKFPNDDDKRRGSPETRSNNPLIYKASQINEDGFVPLLERLVPPGIIASVSSFTQEKRTPLVKTGSQEDLTEERYGSFLAFLRDFFVLNYSSLVAGGEIDADSIDSSLSADFAEPLTQTTYTRVGAVIVYTPK